ncbi:hypothetical protein KJ582_02410 [bacterium]|nr:hypothetical protein [bacterium]
MSFVFRAFNLFVVLAAFFLSFQKSGTRVSFSILSISFLHSSKSKIAPYLFQSFLQPLQIPAQFLYHLIPPY